jgi:arginine-tRNA-protein transferase
VVFTEAGSIEQYLSSAFEKLLVSRSCPFCPGLPRRAAESKLDDNDVVINEFFVENRVSSTDMDRLWADGWRHFGVYFFRYSMTLFDDRPCHVMPLRIELAAFTPSRSQTRILKKNRDLQVVIRDTFIDSSKEALFERHRKRFRENAPDSLFDFLSERPATVPCRNQEICVYRGESLLAASFLDIGETATSAVYAAFEPAEHKRSLGIFTMLRAMEYSQDLGLHYYYPGYACREPSVYDYKKSFAGLEFLEWGGGWQRYARLRGVT